jgi:hypothetical protein
MEKLNGIMAKNIFDVVIQINEMLYGAELIRISATSNRGGVMIIKYNKEIKTVRIVKKDSLTYPFGCEVL